MVENLKFENEFYVGIRPEHLKVNIETDFTFEPEIELIENLGNEKIAYLKKDKFQLSAKIPSNYEIKKTFGFNQKDVFIFDVDGKRLKD